jgi:prephenate dehydrogenase
MRKCGSLAIIGVGLIGGSLGLAVKKRGLFERVIGIGRCKERLNVALKREVVDEITTDFTKGVKDAELVVLAAPVQAISEIALSILPFMSPHSILLDVGSTKEVICDIISRHLPKDVSFVGCHPMAGSEKRGVEAADPDLFEGSICVLTPLDNTSHTSLRTAKELWEGVGCHILTLSPSDHDLFVGITSHIPHITASSLVHFVSLFNESNKDIERLLAGGFRDTTRIASGDPVLWRDVCITNRNSLARLIPLLIQQLERFLDFLKDGDEAEIFAFFQEAKTWRDKKLR